MRSKQHRILFGGSDQGPDLGQVPRVSAMSGVPQRLASASRSQLKDPDLGNSVGEILTSFRQQRPAGVLVGGGNFVSRGQVAACLLNGGIARGLVTRWTEFAEFTDWVGDRVELSKNTSQFDDGLLDEWYGERGDIGYVFEVWVLNDLRLSLMTPFVAKELFKLLSSRYSRDLTTIVTTGETPDDILKAAPDVYEMLDTYEVIAVGSAERVL